MKKYSTWLKVASIVQFLTAGLHSLSLFAKPVPQNDTEKQLLDLMKNYKLDFGGGFHHSMSEVVIALSACFSLVCLFGGLINIYLLRKKTDANVVKGVININLLVFGICFILMLLFTFLPPIILSGLIVLTLGISRVAISRN